MLDAVLDTLAWVTLAYYLVLSTLALCFTIVTWVSLRRYERARHYVPVEQTFASPLTPGISILLPAYNERAGVVESVRSLVALHYPVLEVVVVNDGSTDDTLDQLRSAFDLVPVRRALRETISSETVRQVYVSQTNHDLVVVDKANGGKSDALNAALRVARHPLIAAIDADAVMDENALLEVARPFIDDPELAVASGGVVRISNGCTIDRGRIVKVGVPKDALAAMQSVEYVRAFLIGRIPWSELNALMIVSGAFGLFRRDAVEAVGGYERGTVGEDVELVMRLHRVNRDARRPYRIQFVAYPILWTEGPEDLRSLSRQRRRWQRGLGETLWRTRGMFLRPRYGFVGMATLPFFLVFEFLAPTVALVGVLATIVWWLLGGLSPSFMLVFAFTSFLLGGLLTMAAVTMDQLGGRQRMSNRDLAAAMGWSLVSNVGYPQFIEACQTVGYVDLARGKKTWGAQRRRGIGTTTDTD